MSTTGKAEIPGDACADCIFRKAAWQLNAFFRRKNCPGADSAACAKSALRRAAPWPGWGRLIIVICALCLFSDVVLRIAVPAPGAPAADDPASPRPLSPPLVPRASPISLQQQQPPPAGALTRPAARQCPGCGKVIVNPGARYCNQCGTRLP